MDWSNRTGLNGLVIFTCAATHVRHVREKARGGDKGGSTLQRTARGRLSTWQAEEKPGADQVQVQGRQVARLCGYGSTGWPEDWKFRNQGSAREQQGGGDKRAAAAQGEGGCAGAGADAGASARVLCTRMRTRARGRAPASVQERRSSMGWSK